MQSFCIFERCDWVVDWTWTDHNEQTVILFGENVLDCSSSRKDCLHGLGGLAQVNWPVGLIKWRGEYLGDFFLNESWSNQGVVSIQSSIFSNSIVGPSYTAICIKNLSIQQPPSNLIYRHSSDSIVKRPFSKNKRSPVRKQSCVGANKGGVVAFSSGSKIKKDESTRRPGFFWVAIGIFSMTHIGKRTRPFFGPKAENCPSRCNRSATCGRDLNLRKKFLVAYASSCTPTSPTASTMLEDWLRAN